MFRRAMYQVASLTGIICSFGQAQEKLLSVNGHDSDGHLGSSVDGTGDVNGDGVDDLLVGQDGATLLARLYSGADGSLLFTWSGDKMGDPVAAAGDVNLDGFADVMIGAPFAKSGNGRVYVFSGKDGSQLYLLNGDPVFGVFGLSISGASDVNGDGHPDLMVGAPGSATDDPYVRVFSGRDASTIYTFYPPNPIDRLGASVAGSEDLDGDAVPDLLAGATNYGGVGSVFAYSGRTGALLYRRMGVGAIFGGTLNGAPDVDGDGRGDFIVQDDNIAEVCSGVDGSTIFKWPGTSDDFCFGCALDAAGDANGDGICDFIVGDLVGDSLHGYAWLFSGKTGAALYQFNTPTDDYLGSSVAAAGDLNHDGFADVIIGALGVEDGAKVDAGAAYVFGGNDLYHRAQPRTVRAGDTLKHTTREGSPGAPVVLAVVAINFIPTFHLLFGVGAFDATGSRVIANLVVPPGLAGLDLTHRAYALTPSGKMIESAPEIVSFR